MVDGWTFKLTRSQNIQCKATRLCKLNITKVQSEVRIKDLSLQWPLQLSRGYFLETSACLSPNPSFIPWYLKAGSLFDWTDKTKFLLYSGFVVAMSECFATVMLSMCFV